MFVDRLILILMTRLEYLLSSMKRKNPYTVLLELARSYIVRIKNRKDIHNFYYGIDKIENKELYSLNDLYYETRVASKLGYDTVLRATTIGLEVHFIEKIPQPPYNLYEGNI